MTDQNLALEVAKSPIDLTYFDFVNNKLVYKAPIPADFSGKIYEVGVYSLSDDPNAGEFASRLITSFDSATESWLTGASVSTFTTANTRVGVDSLNLTPALSANTTAALGNINLDLSGYSSADVFQLAYNVGNANTSSIRWRFKTDGSNYYDLNQGGQTAGYKVIEVSKGSASATGSPSWANITEIQVTVVSGAGGASAVDLDAIRIQDKDSASLDYILVARKVLATPVTSIAGQAQDLEFTLDVTL